MPNQTTNSPAANRNVANAQPIRLLMASSNPGKLAEMRAIAAAAPQRVPIELELLAGFSELTEFEESAPTFAENAAGKALYYSRFAGLPVVADDSGLVMPRFGGAPGVQSARYAGPNATDGERIGKLLFDLRQHRVCYRDAYFVSVIALARRGHILGVFSDRVDGEILSSPRGKNGFGYDPIFYFDPLNKTFGEMTAEEKNQYSHRGKAFRKLLEFVATPGSL